MLSHEAALIYAMVVAAGADREVAPDDLDIIGDLAGHLPVFDGIDRGRAIELATVCSEQLSEPGGIDQVYTQIRAALSGPLRAAAYALCCDVIALDCRLERDEALERIRTQLEVEPATAQSIERAARVRFQAA